MKDTIINLRVEKALKEEVILILEEQGLSMSQFIQLVLKEVQRSKRVPLQLILKDEDQENKDDLVRLKGESNATISEHLYRKMTAQKK
jgi:addiction module RelB/DinJ family antitoxin